MADNTTYAGTFDEWRRLLKPLATNNGDTPHLEGHRARLETVLVRVDEIVTLQASLTAAKQEASLELKGLVVEGRKAAAFLKAGIRDHYGRRSEKVAAYGLQPFRGKKTAKPEEPTEVKSPKSGSTTTPTA